MSSLTSEMNKTSIDHIQAMIEKKNSFQPYYATNKSILPSVTDMDHHPYTRFYRGVYYYPDPIVFEREAGWREIQDHCYNLNIPPQEESVPRLCFQAPCSTVFSCHPENKSKYSEHENLTNNNCIVQYR